MPPGPQDPSTEMGPVPEGGPSLGNLLRQSLVGDAQAQTRQQPTSVASEPVKAMQQELKVKGYYGGPIDGVMGTATQAAKAAYEKDEQVKQSQALELGKAGAETEKAKAAAAETERLRMAAEQDAARRAQGDQRMQDMEGQVSPFSRAIREYGPALGTLAGFLGGGLTRYKVVNASNKASQAAAKEAEAIMAKPAADTAAQVGRVNNFWTQGQKGGSPEAPFIVGGNRKNGYSSNAEAPQASSLYQQTSADKMNNRLTDAAIPAGGIAEWAVVDSTLGERGRANLAEAQKAVQLDPSEANIRWLQSAKDKLAAADSISSMGRSFAGGYGSEALVKRRSFSRPSTMEAEAEQMKLSQLLKGGGGSAPPQAAVATGGTGKAPHWVAQPRLPDGRFTVKSE